MDPSSPARRSSLVAAAVAGGVMAAMIVEIALARRGLELIGGWQGMVHAGGRQVHAALAWWAITGSAFVASFVIAAIVSRFSWLYFRSLRGLAIAAGALGLATIADAVPLSAPGVAGHHALATLAALTVATMMAAFGGFFAVR
jgi:hypothetical protein